MSELLQKLKAGRSAVARVTLGKVELGLVVLTEQDYLESGLESLEIMKAAGHDDANVANSDYFEQLKATELLVRAVVDPDTGQRVFKTGKDLRDAISRAEKALLVERYVDHERNHSPAEWNMGEKEFAALLEEVKKTPETTRLNDFGSVTLKKLIRSLACPPLS